MNFATIASQEYLPARDSQPPAHSDLPVDSFYNHGQVLLWAAAAYDLREGGELRDTGHGEPTYALARPVGFAERWRLTAYFRLSLVRATLRWFKYVLTFDDWLDYLLRKVRRHTGQDIELTSRERRHPLLFLWPKVVRYLLHKNDAAARTP